MHVDLDMDINTCLVFVPFVPSTELHKPLEFPVRGCLCYVNEVTPSGGAQREHQDEGWVTGQPIKWLES